MRGPNLGRSMAMAVSDGVKQRLFNYAIWLIALWASAFNLLNHHSYPLFTAEVGLLLAGMAVAAVLMGTLVQVAGPRIGFLFSSLFVAIAIDLNVSLSLTKFYFLWGGLAVVAWFFERALLKVTGAAFASVLLFQFIALTTGVGAHQRPGDETQVRQAIKATPANRAPVIHLVLDSYIGLDGMALGPVEVRKLRGEQAAFFAREGFQVYPQAYSRHVKTINSLPHLFSYGEAPLATTPRNLQYYVPDRLAYFADLDARGYRIDATLPDYVDLCVKQPMTRCHNYERSGLDSMRGTDIPVGDRATVFAFTLLQLTALPSRAAEAMVLGANDLFGLDGRRPYDRPKLLPLVSLDRLDEFTAGLANLERGDVRLAHLLVPHDPYMLDARCRALPGRQWLDEHGPGAVDARQAAYADQVRCLTSRIDRMMDALDRTPAGRQAIVIIHGDHGSRITPVVPFLDGPALTELEVLTSHSTLFAIRVPGELAATVDGPVALDELMGDFARRDFASAPRPPRTPARVYLMDMEWIPREMRDLPDFAR